MIGAALVLGLSTVLKLPLVRGLDGRRHNLVAEARGEPLALVFIAHNCPICNTYAPEFARISASYGKRVFFGLIYSEPDLSISLAKAHARAYGLTKAHLFIDTSGQAAKACGAGITPEAAVFDSKGKRTYLGRVDDLFYDFGKQRRAATTHDLRAALDATLAHRHSKPASGPPFGCVIETS